VKQSRSSTDAWQEGSKSCRSGLKMRPQIAPKLLQARYKQLLDGGSLLATNLDHQKLGRATMVLLYAGLFVARADGRGLKRSVRLAARVSRCSRHHWRLRIETAASLTSREKARHSGKVGGRKTPKRWTPGPL
jgi:hypothetical protein